MRTPLFVLADYAAKRDHARHQIALTAAALHATEFYDLRDALPPAVDAYVRRYLSRDRFED